MKASLQEYRSSLCSAKTALLGYQIVGNRPGIFTLPLSRVHLMTPYAHVHLYDQPKGFTALLDLDEQLYSIMIFRKAVQRVAILPRFCEASMKVD